MASIQVTLNHLDDAMTTLQIVHDTINTAKSKGKTDTSEMPHGDLLSTKAKIDDIVNRLNDVKKKM